MAKPILKTDYKNDILSPDMDNKRRYEITEEDDGRGGFSIVEITDFEQVGTDFGASDINTICGAINESADKNNVLNTISDVAHTSNQEHIVGAMAIKDSVFTSEKYVTLSSHTEFSVSNTEKYIGNDNNVVDNEYYTTTKNTTGSVGAEITVKKSGLYYIGAFWTFSHAGGTGHLQIDANGEWICYDRRYTYSNVLVGGNFAKLAFVEAGTKIKWKIGTNGGSGKAKDLDLFLCKIW